MMRKYGSATLVSLALPFSHTSATPATGTASTADDTIMVDRNGLIEVLRGVAVNEMRN